MDNKDDNRDPSTAIKSVLVVADLDLNEMLFDHLLRQEWTVEYVSSNHEAFSLCSRKRIDLVITAEGTSAIEDIELLRRIRRVHPHTHMIILTHESTTQDVILALRDGAFSYFSPPYTFESLREMIHLAIEEPSWDDGIEVASATPSWVRLLVRCETGAAQRLVRFIEEMIDMPEEEKGHVAYAFREMLTNAITHGGKFDPWQYVEISYLRARHAVACRIKDPGLGFSLDELHHAAVLNPPDDPMRHMGIREGAGLSPGGYGILLSRHMVDELIYNEQGNEVLLIKYLLDVPTAKLPV